MLSSVWIMFLLHEASEKAKIIHHLYKNHRKCILSVKVFADFS